MHSIRFGWKLKTLLTLALPLLLTVAGCEEDDSESDGEGDCEAGTMAVEVEVCIAPGESEGGEVSEPVDHVEPAVEVAEEVAVSGSDN
jgi:hypothetical protein